MVFFVMSLKFRTVNTFTGTLRQPDCISLNSHTDTKYGVPSTCFVLNLRFSFAYRYLCKHLASGRGQQGC